MSIFYLILRTRLYAIGALNMLKRTPAFSIRKPSYRRPREECGKIINMSRQYILKCTKIAGGQYENKSGSSKEL